MLKEGLYCRGLIVNNKILSRLYMLKRKSIQKSVDFNLSIYKFDLINAELEVFKNSKKLPCL
jgi:hypothetical protein